MRHSFLFTFFICLTFNMTFSQDLPDILPPAPEVSSFGKFSEVPVSYYTGLPNISIPLGSYSVEDKSFPVSLSYHARGIKVDEIASRVGIGWALNAGGVISRQTRDKPDDGEGGYINRYNILMDALANGTFFTSESARSSYYSADLNYSVPPDKFPDQFNLSAGNISAKFIFDYKDDQPVVQSFGDLDIKYDIGDVTGTPNGTNLIKSFTVTDKDGFTYYFGVSKDGTRVARNWDKNWGNYRFPQNSSYNVTSEPYFSLSFNSWLLMDVESPNGEIVSFTYQEESPMFYSRSYDMDDDNSGVYTNYTTKLESHQYQLKEILYSGGKITFNAIDSRQDFNGGKELDQVKIYDQNLNLVKTFQLYQSYPSTVIDGNKNSQLSGLEPQAAKRLFLDSIVEIGKNNLKKPAYEFKYNSQALPNRFSNSQDLWGFYNGADNGEFLKFYGASNEVNRRVDADKSLAGMLEIIKYPTGGYTKFTYEQNIGSLGGEFNNIRMPNLNSIESKSAVLSFFNSNLYINGQYEKIITISNISGGLKIDVDLPEIDGVDQNWACGNPIQNDCRFDISLVGINGNPNSYYNIFSGQQTLGVQSGDYKLIFNPDYTLNWDPNPPNTPAFSVGLSWDEEVVSGNFISAAGKRIKKIEFFDTDGIKVSQKSYEYKQSDGTESGVILSIPYFRKLRPDFNFGFNVTDWRGAVPGGLYKTYQGNTIGYQRVSEYFGTEGVNQGKTIYSYRVNTDTDDYTTYPVAPPTDNEWLRGLLTYADTYKVTSNGTYKIVKSVYNEYKCADQVPFFEIFEPLSKRLSLTGTGSNWSNPGTDIYSAGLLYSKTQSLFRLPLISLYFGLDSNNNYNTMDIHYKIHHLTGGTLSNYKTTQTLYDDNENPTLTTVTEKEFNYQKHYQPSVVLSSNSDGDKTIQTFTYPQDLVTGYSIHPTTYSSDPTTALAEQNRVVPLITRDYKDYNNNDTADTSELLNTIETSYSWNGGVLEPNLVKTGKGASPTLVDRINYHSYYTNGKLKEVSIKDGTHIVYIWGYNRQFPIAKIENATYSQVSGQVSNLESLSNLDDDTCMDSGTCSEKNLRASLNSLRNSLPNAIVTTYTYDPLIGVTSITDPKGYTTYYEYDDLNRLKRAKDSNGKILGENTYYYRSQP